MSLRNIVLIPAGRTIGRPYQRDRTFGHRGPALWREYLTNAGIIDKAGANPRQDFRRLKDQLTERGVIGEWNGLVWAVKNG